MTAVEIRGLAALRQRLAEAAAPQPLKQILRAEAEALAEEARQNAPGELGRSVEVRDVSRGTRHEYAIGTPDPAGRYLEFGTARRPAAPWLWSVFRARLPGIKQRLRKLAAAAPKTPTVEV